MIVAGWSAAPPRQAPARRKGKQRVGGRNPQGKRNGMGGWARTHGLAFDDEALIPPGHPTAPVRPFFNPFPRPNQTSSQKRSKRKANAVRRDR
eukprot:15445237-Alexandrium_andersonii.AAC.1